MEGSKKKLIISIVIAVVVIALIVLGYMYYPRKPKLSPEELLVQKQMQELDALREKINAKQLTPEEIQEQMKKLDEIKKQYGVKPATQETIDKQSSELDALKNSQ